MTKKQDNKPIIETIINTTALALTSKGVILMTYQPVTSELIIGAILILFGGSLEYFKYLGRKQKLW